ncbi:Cobalt-precorrin-6y C5-methyltransferase [Carbonactinospora thermoautotrophica]|uniref:Cobalt-precorrin-6y C5-methyltransferase n=3 Tax=Carbonactinospora thermoautotrophica TaxID=1469144 RepID=A0A132MUP8_9ACTN|nr:Cobalt-precorrin-6y C5-methyltransferase [Carbonactinospora thermoautotrophica]
MTGFARRRITVIGYHRDTMSARALDKLATATLVVAGERYFDLLPVPERAQRCAFGRLDTALDVIAAHQGHVVVVASGDPGFFGIVRALAERFGPDELEVLPALSSVAAAFSRLGLPWDDAVVVSAHGRDIRPAINACRAYPKVAVLTGPGTGPRELAQGLAGTGRRLAVLSNLGEPGESVVRMDVDEAAKTEFAGPLNVTVVLDEQRLVGQRRVFAGPPRAPRRWALHEDAYEHRDSMITKSEVRALALAKLGPGLGDLVWDVGAGSGSVAVECARFGAAVIAIERDPQACAMIRRNAQAHDVYVEVVEGSAPEAFAGLPDPDAIFVGGGAMEVIEASARRGAQRVVVALAALERVSRTRRVLSRAGYAVGGVLLHAERLTELPDGVHRLAAVNPVFVLWGERR